jgi:hypothetical protein
VKTFACDTNSGAEVLYVSFVPPAGINAFNAFEVRVQLMPAGGNPALISSWWDLGGCRSGALLGGVVPSSGACTDPYGGAGAGGTGYSTLNQQLLLVTAGPTGVALDPNTEYYGGRFVIQNPKTLGSGSCGGCTQPLGLYVRSPILHQVSPGPDYAFPDSLRSYGVMTASYVTWQCPGTPIIIFDYTTGYWITGWDFGGCATATKRSTWGGIKSLYR